MNQQTILVIIGVIVLAGAGWFLLTRDNTQTQIGSTQEQTDSEENTQVTQDLNCERTFTDADLEAATVEESDKFVTLTVRGFGDIKLELNRAEAPLHSENFIKLAKAGFYNCLTFHRVAAGFVIQGGDPEGTGAGGPGYTVPAEIGLLHDKYALAAARQGDAFNPERASSGSQFYIALEPLAALDGQYSVFGKVVSGQEVVDQIGQVQIDSPLGDGTPIEPVIIEKAEVSAE